MIETVIRMIQRRLIVITLMIRDIRQRFKGNRYFLKYYVRKATRKHKKTGLRYRVYFDQVILSYIIIHRDDLHDLKDKGRVNYRGNVTNLRTCFFDTNSLHPCS